MCAALRASSIKQTIMEQVKDTVRAIVRIGYDGRVHKTFRGTNARQRYETEVKVLRHLEKVNCPFVPRLLENSDEELKIVTTNAGQRVERMSEAKMQATFDALKAYGVIHEDPFLRNITYRASDGRFCVIDFEFATIIDLPMADPQLARVVDQD